MGVFAPPNVGTPIFDGGIRSSQNWCQNTRQPDPWWSCLFFFANWIIQFWDQIISLAYPKIIANFSLLWFYVPLPIKTDGMAPKKINYILLKLVGAMWGNTRAQTVTSCSQRRQPYPNRPSSRLGNVFLQPIKVASFSRKFAVLPFLKPWVVDFHLCIFCWCVHNRNWDFSQQKQHFATDTGN